MKKRTIGKTDIRSGAFGLGCNKLLDPSDAEMVKVANEAIDLGMTQFDGADMYGGGKCEDFLGMVLKNRRDEVTVVSKFGVVRAPDGQSQRVDVTPAYVRQACDASLRRLGMDYIDLYYQHRLDPNVPVEDTIGAMADLVAAGKIGAVGLCNTNADHIRRAHKVYPIAAVQMEYSLMERGVETDILPTCKELGITFVAYGPLTYAFLSGEVKSRGDLPQGDMFRLRQTRFEDENLKHNYAMLMALTDIADAVGATLAQVALAWCLHRPYDVLPIPGSSKVRHLRENAQAADIALSAAQVASLDAAFTPVAMRGDGRQALAPSN